MVLADPITGQQVASFRATGAPAQVDEEETINLKRPPRIHARLREQQIPPLMRSEGDDLTMPLPDITSMSQMQPREVTEKSIVQREQGDDLTMPLPVTPETTGINQISAAEVWRRWKRSWTSAGKLSPGHQVHAFGGWVRLTTTGDLIVNSGPRLSGSATLPDGNSQEIPKDSSQVHFPAGSTVMLRWEENGVYVRSDAPKELPAGAAI